MSSDSTPPFSLASDNAAGVHPAVMEALARANSGYAAAYGYDAFTAAADRKFDDLFGRSVETFYVWGGTGANVVAMACAAMANGPRWTVICTDVAHIHVDENAAPERMFGLKLLATPSADAKLSPSAIDRAAVVLGDEHHPQPGIVSITQSTESGTLYSVEEIAALCDTAHSYGMFVHLDGARIANATAALGGTSAALRSFTIDVGVDVISFGGTKNGMMYGEAIVFCNPALAGPAKFVRKQMSQLPSKMRYIAAQFDALLTDGLWIANAEHANAMARRLHDGVTSLPQVHCPVPPVVNSMFPTISSGDAESLRNVAPFYDWDSTRHQVRWMTSWETRADQVDAFCHAASQLAPTV